MRRLGFLIVPALAATAVAAWAGSVPPHPVGGGLSGGPQNQGLPIGHDGYPGPLAQRARVTPTALTSSRLASKLARARLGTAKYVTDLARAKADGYRIITPMIPDMGYHFLNPKVRGFDVARPPILVYLERRGSWQLGALEWVFPKLPKTPSLPGAHYGVFGAACHYVDGTFVFERSKAACAGTSPASDSAFSFWHPNLVTLHLWLWYPNPQGIYSGINPLVRPFNQR
jgi:hypothetical protein